MKWADTRLLQYTDLETLLVKSAKKWNGELVSVEILKLKKELGNIKYAVGDYGGDIKRGRDLQVLFIYMICHT